MKLAQNPNGFGKASSVVKGVTEEENEAREGGRRGNRQEEP